MHPSEEVLELFAVPGDVRPVPGGQGHSVLAGDLVLSPGRDAATADWLNPVLAPLAARLDETRPRSLRIAMPIPARDGRWVVDGWGATRYEPGTSACTDLDVILATGCLLHARFRSAVPHRPPGIGARSDRWFQAQAAAFDPTRLPEALHGNESATVQLIAEHWEDLDLGPDQLVHGDLAGNILLDAQGVPLVIDTAPYWRPELWAETVAVLDSVLCGGTDPHVLDRWCHGRPGQALLRAVLFRLLSDQPTDETAYRQVLDILGIPTSAA